MDVEVNKAGQVTRYNNVVAKLEGGLYVVRTAKNEVVCIMDGAVRTRSLFAAGFEVSLGADATVTRVMDEDSGIGVETERRKESA